MTFQNQNGLIIMLEVALQNADNGNFYEFDNLGRLKNIKGKDGNILKNYEYAYAN